MSNNIDVLLSTINSMAAKAANIKPLDQPTVDSSGSSFEEILKSSINQVNDVQKSAELTQKKFEQGDPNTNLQDVVVALQKASLSFETMVQVRNKLTSAYQEIMNTQV